MISPSETIRARTKSADLNKALEINSADVDARFERGMLRGATGDLDGALSDLRRSVDQIMKTRESSLPQPSQ